MLVFQVVDTKAGSAELAALAFRLSLSRRDWLPAEESGASGDLRAALFTPPQTLGDFVHAQFEIIFEQPLFLLRRQAVMITLSHFSFF